MKKTTEPPGGSTVQKQNGRLSYIRYLKKILVTGNRGACDTVHQMNAFGD